MADPNPRAPLRGVTPPTNPLFRATVVGNQPDVLSALNAVLRSEGAEIVEQANDPRELPDDPGRRTDVVFLEAVGFGGSRWRDLLRDARRRLPAARIVLVTRSPGHALEGPAQVEGADGLVHYPIHRTELKGVLTGLFPLLNFSPEKGHVSGAYPPGRSGRQ